ncbi:hypothetical protein AAC387_Pa10g1720 [Persea americana]
MNADEHITDASVPTRDSIRDPDLEDLQDGALQDLQALQFGALQDPEDLGGGLALATLDKVYVEPLIHACTSYAVASCYKIASDPYLVGHPVHLAHLDPQVVLLAHLVLPSEVC